MITGALKSKIDSIWDTMWSGGISNPLSVIEQLTYLLFIKRLDELQFSSVEAHRSVFQKYLAVFDYFDSPRRSRGLGRPRLANGRGAKTTLKCAV